MRMNEHDELMIQRCLDDELSVHDTRLLMSRLNQVSDGWKTLACGFLQERSIARGVLGQFPENAGDFRTASAVTSSTEGVPSTLPPPEPQAAADRISTMKFEAAQHSIPGRRKLRHWWSHPVTSLSLCGAIAFVAGLLIPDLRPNSDRIHLAGNDSASRTAMTDPLLRSNASGRSKTPQQNAQSGHGAMLAADYRVQFHPDGDSVREPVNIPVTRDYDTVLNALRNNDQRARQMLRQFPELRADSHAGGGQLNAVRVPLDETHDVLIFLDDRSFGQPPQ